MIENVVHQGQLLAIIVTAACERPGLHFVTPEHLSQQVACMRYPAGRVISPHDHAPCPRQVDDAQEVLIVRRGRLQVDLYDAQRGLVARRVLAAGDVAVLVAGGHGFEVLEELELVEVKQGPYLGDRYTVRFGDKLGAAKVLDAG